MFEILDNYWLFLLIGEYPNGPLGGLAMTLILSSLTLVMAFPLGVILGVVQVCPIKSLSVVATIWVWFIRAIPVMMIIFWMYFAMPFLLGASIGKFPVVLLSLVLFESAYIAIIISSGVNELSVGQVEAARSLGFSYFDSMSVVVLPQVIKNMLPSLVGEFVAIIKLTSLGYVVGLSDLTFVAEQVNSQLITKPAEVYILLGAGYFILCYGLTRLSYWIERRISIGSRGGVSA